MIREKGEQIEEIMKAVASTKMANSMAGLIDSTLPLAANSVRVAPNIGGTPLFEGQGPLGATAVSRHT